MAPLNKCVSFRNRYTPLMNLKICDLKTKITSFVWHWFLTLKNSISIHQVLSMSIPASLAVLTPPPCPGSLLAGVNGFCRPRTKVPPRDLTFCVDNLVIYLANLCRVAGRAYVALCAFLALPHRAPAFYTRRPLNLTPHNATAPALPREGEGVRNYDPSSMWKDLNTGCELSTLV